MKNPQPLARQPLVGATFIFRSPQCWRHAPPAMRSVQEMEAIMAMFVRTADPLGLLGAIRDGIRKRKIITWEEDKEGDLTHSPDQWRGKAWLRPKVENNRLVFTILTYKNVQLTTEVYSVFHGRFIEMLL